MAEIKLKKKITLRKKEEQADFTFNGSLRVSLFWKSHTDLDLCIFFKKKDGTVGGVFSNEYRGKKSDLGSLEHFPYIKHAGDNKVPAPGGEENEQVDIVSLDEIDTAYAVVVNYDAAIDERDVTFADESGRIELMSDSGDYLEVLADSHDEGPVFEVCTIKNNDGTYALKNESKAMDLGTAFEDIPGFALITNEG